MRRLRVLHSPTDDSNPFFQQLADSLPADLTTLRFSWRTALLGRYDVLHLHWPERLMRGGTRGQAAIKSLLSLLLLLRLRLLGTPVVRTWHNSTPHDPPTRHERWVLARIEEGTTVVVAMTGSRVPSHGRVEVIPHGSYEDWYEFDRDRPHQPDRLLYFGRIRPYKGVPDLLALYRDPDFRPPWRLHVAGWPTTPDLARTLDLAVSSSEGVTASLRFTPEAELLTELARSAAVVLPAPGMENSGSLLLALSAHRPVIAPRTPTNEAIRDEVGAEWLYLYPEPLTGSKLLACWRDLVADAPARKAPDLSQRSWSRLGPRYAGVYRSVAPCR